MTFQLKPNRKETENKTIRFPIPLIEKIDNTILNQDVTFSSFVASAPFTAPKVTFPSASTDASL